MTFFRKRLISMVLTLSVITLLLIVSTMMVGFRWSLVIQRIPAVIARFSELYFPLDFSDLAKMLEALWNTILLAIAAAGVGMIFSFFGALAISKKTGKIPVLNTVIRFIANLLRIIPPGVWALVLIFTFWYGYFLAFLVMLLYSFGFLTRVFADTFDETNPDCIDALHATGASYAQLIIHGVIPEVTPGIISWALYAIENNVRSSTIIGLLTGSGIGYLIGYYKHMRLFSSLAVGVILVVIIVILIDQVSVQIRKRILS